MTGLPPAAVTLILNQNTAGGAGGIGARRQSAGTSGAAGDGRSTTSSLVFNDPQERRQEYKPPVISAPPPAGGGACSASFGGVGGGAGGSANDLARALTGANGPVAKSSPSPRPTAIATGGASGLSQATVARPRRSRPRPRPSLRTSSETDGIVEAASASASRRRLGNTRRAPLTNHRHHRRRRRQPMRDKSTSTSAGPGTLIDSEPRAGKRQRDRWRRQRGPRRLRSVSAMPDLPTTPLRRCAGVRPPQCYRDQRGSGGQQQDQDRVRHVTRSSSLSANWAVPIRTRERSRRPATSTISETVDLVKLASPKNLELGYFYGGDAVRNQGSPAWTINVLADGTTVFTDSFTSAATAAKAFFTNNAVSLGSLATGTLSNPTPERQHPDVRHQRQGQLRATSDDVILGDPPASATSGPVHDDEPQLGRAPRYQGRGRLLEQAATAQTWPARRV